MTTSTPSEFLKSTLNPSQYRKIDRMLSYVSTRQENQIILALTEYITNGGTDDPVEFTAEFAMKFYGRNIANQAGVTLGVKP